MNTLVVSEPRPQGTTAGAPAQFLSFMLGTEMFALGILAVREILEFAGVTPVPQMPAYVCGVINLRGAAVAVLDLARRLGREPSAVSKRTCIIVLEVQGEDEPFVVGILVDAVNAVLDIPGADIEPPPKFGAQVRSDMLRGIGKVNGRFVLLLDEGHVVAEREIAELARGEALL